MIQCYIDSESNPNITFKRNPSFVWRYAMLTIQQEAEASGGFIRILCNAATARGYRTDDVGCKLKYAGSWINRDNLFAEASCSSQERDGLKTCLASPEFLLHHRDLVLNPSSGCRWGLYGVTIATDEVCLGFHDMEAGRSEQPLDVIHLTSPLFSDANGSLEIEVPTKIAAGVPNIVDLMDWRVSSLRLHIYAPTTGVIQISVWHPKCETFLPAVTLAKNPNSGKGIVQRHYLLSDISDKPIYLPNGSVGHMGIYGAYWASSRSGSVTLAFRFYFNAIGTNPAGYDNYYRGFPLRCRQS